MCMLKCTASVLWYDRSWWGSIREDVMRPAQESPTDTRRSTSVSVIRDKTTTTTQTALWHKSTVQTENWRRSIWRRSKHASNESLAIYSAIHFPNLIYTHQRQRDFLEGERQVCTQDRLSIHCRAQTHTPSTLTPVSLIMHVGDWEGNQSTQRNPRWHGENMQRRPSLSSWKKKSSLGYLEEVFIIMDTKKRKILFLPEQNKELNIIMDRKTKHRKGKITPLHYTTICFLTV